MPKVNSISLLASFVLIVGGACMSLLTFAIYFSFTFAIFIPTTTRDQALGNGSIVGAVPIIAGAILVFFGPTRKIGTILTLAGSVVLTAYLVICYIRLNFDSMELIWKLVWFALLPAVVIATDVAAYRIYKLTQPSEPAKAVAASAG